MSLHVTWGNTALHRLIILDHKISICMNATGFLIYEQEYVHMYLSIIYIAEPVFFDCMV